MTRMLARDAHHRVGRSADVRRVPIGDLGIGLTQNVQHLRYTPFPAALHLVVRSGDHVIGEIEVSSAEMVRDEVRGNLRAFVIQGDCGVESVCAFEVASDRDIQCSLRD